MQKRALAEKAARKRLLASVDAAKSLRRALARDIATRERQRLERQLALQAKLSHGLAGQKVGKHKVPEGEIDVQLGEELSESLRALKVRDDTPSWTCWMLTCLPPSARRQPVQGSLPQHAAACARRAPGCRSVRVALLYFCPNLTDSSLAGGFIAPRNRRARPKSTRSIRTRGSIGSIEGTGCYKGLFIVRPSGIRAIRRNHALGARHVSLCGF